MGNCKSVNRNSDETFANLILTTKDNVARDSFQTHIKRFAFIVALSVKDINRMVINKNRIHKFEVDAEITLCAADSGKALGQDGIFVKKKWGGGGGGGGAMKRNVDWRKEG